MGMIVGTESVTVSCEKKASYWMIVIKNHKVINYTTTIS